MRDSVVFTTGVPASTESATATGIGKVVVHGEMEGSQILTQAGGASEVKIGPVHIRGDFVASSIAAAINPVNDFYGDEDDEAVIPGNDPSLAARIAKITIGGQVLGTDVAGDSYGIVAERIGMVKFGNTVVPIAADPTGVFTFGPDEDVIVRNVER